MPMRRIQRTRLVFVLGAGLPLLAAAACGTRLPDSAFASQTPGAPGTTAAGSANPASDVGITPTSIKIGMIDSVDSLLGPDTFSGPMYGAQAFFKALNAAGGVDGRQISFVTCDDQGVGGTDVSCAHTLIDQDEVFAFAGNSIFQYDGASYVSAKDVPDIGGEPISNAYDQYPHLYSIYGSDYPRDGKSIGWQGKLYSSTEAEHYAKTVLKAHVAGLVSYNQADSARFASYEAQALRAEGFTVVPEQLDIALADFDSAALDMKNKGVDVVFDTIDTDGNARLCKAIEDAGVPIKAKMTTVQSWDATVATTYKDAPKCRNLLYANSSDANYEDTSNPAVKAFRDAMAKYFPDREGKLSEWEIDGWASAQWLTDAVASCGADVTRVCVEKFMNSGKPYDAHGIITPAAFTVKAPSGTTHACFNVAQWQDSADGGKGGWVTRVPDMDTNCYDVPEVSYSP
ncbi:branched-chain amino acid transport system substrate-binding protein [Catenulispora sp. MAP5-51]|uniref:ABC transporter substrate-binding protein n=1 Tax=Catenulispora sp. MAP5-51 TaxID=3156298 RepID=UPI0035163C0B